MPILNLRGKQLLKLDKIEDFFQDSLEKHKKKKKTLDVVVDFLRLYTRLSTNWITAKQWRSGLTPYHWEMAHVEVSGSIFTFAVDLAVGSFGWFPPNLR